MADVNILEKVMTVTEAAERWGKSTITVRHACSGYKRSPSRFKENEIRQSGSTWLITIDGMTRVFGPEPNHDSENV